MHFLDANRTLGPMPNGEHSFVDEAALLTDMDSAGIDEAFVSLSWQRLLDPRDDSHFADVTLQSPRLRLVPTFLPGHPAMRDDLEHLARRHPLLHCAPWPGMDSLASSALDTWKRLDGVGATVSVDVEALGWSTLERLSGEYPNIKVLALATGYRSVARILSVAQVRDSVWFEMGTMVSAGTIEYLVDRIGAARLVFGTGAPQRDSGGPVHLLRHARISDEDRALIAGENLQELVART